MVVSLLPSKDKVMKYVFEFNAEELRKFCQFKNDDRKGICLFIRDDRGRMREAYYNLYYDRATIVRKEHRSMFFGGSNEYVWFVIGDILDLSKIEADVFEFVYSKENLNVLLMEVV